MTTPASISDEAVHAMCAYLASGQEHAGVCKNCPREVSTKYGSGEPACFGIALETLEAARSFDRRAKPAEGGHGAEIAALHHDLAAVREELRVVREAHNELALLAGEFARYPLTPNRDYAKETRWQRLQSAVRPIDAAPPDSGGGK